MIPAYHTEPFGKDAAPIELYQSMERARSDMPGWEVLSLAKMESAPRKVSYMGIKLNNIWYWNDALRHMVGEEVSIKYNKTDNLSITVLKDNKFICEAAIKDKLKLIGEQRERIETHVRLQNSTRREVKEAINRAHTAADIALRNVIYEPIDQAVQEATTITTLEYKKAAKAKADTRAEIERIATSEPHDDRVKKMFMERGRKTFNRSQE